MVNLLEYYIVLGLILNDFVSSNDTTDLVETEDTTSDKIVKGLPVDPPFKYPWMASIQQGHFPFCGGVMIATNALITARHCSVKGDNDDFKVLLHRHDLWKSNKEESGIEMKVLERIYHPDADIALWKLSSHYNHTQDSIMLLPNGTDVKAPQSGEIATALGWGRTSGNGRASHILQEVQVPLVEPKKCEHVWNNRRNIRFRPSIQVCAGWPEGERDTCKGDSGGPLFVMRGNVPMIVGLTSFGEPCAKPNVPTVYVKVEPFIDWIIKNMNDPISSTVKPVPGAIPDESSETNHHGPHDQDTDQDTDQSDESNNPTPTTQEDESQNTSTGKSLKAASNSTPSPINKLKSRSIEQDTTKDFDQPQSDISNDNETPISEPKLEKFREFIKILIQKSQNFTQLNCEKSINPKLSINFTNNTQTDKLSNPNSPIQETSVKETLPLDVPHPDGSTDSNSDFTSLLNDETLFSKFAEIFGSIENAHPVTDGDPSKDSNESTEAQGGKPPGKPKPPPPKPPVKPPKPAPKPTAKPPPKPTPKPTPKPLSTVTVTTTIKPICTVSTMTTTATMTITTTAMTTVTTTIATTVTVTPTPLEPPDDDDDDDGAYNAEIPYNMYIKKHIHKS